MQEFELTVGITSFNRLKYLKSLFTSLDSLDRRQIQFVVVDNGSVEIGLHNFLLELHSAGKIHELHLRPHESRNWVNDEYIAKNQIITDSKSDVILFLQDDLQFIATQEILLNAARTFLSLEVPCCETNAVRKSTIAKHFNVSKQYYARRIKFWTPGNNHFQTMGFFRKDIFEKVGPYPTEWPQMQAYWGHSEDWYDNQVKKMMAHKYPFMNVSLWVPLFAPVWNDPRGGYAFIRGNKRYGYYIDAPQKMYYKQLSASDFYKLQETGIPRGFSDVCTPQNWIYNVDADGDQVKFPQNLAMIDGPEEVLF